MAETVCVTVAKGKRASWQSAEGLLILLCIVDRVAGGNLGCIGSGDVVLWFLFGPDELRFALGGFRWGGLAFNSSVLL